MEERGQLLKIIRQLWIPFLIAALISGGFYARNVIIFHNPVVSSADFIPLTSFAQPIVPRNFSFFTNVSAFWRFDLYQAKNYSFLGGTYFSWFYDGHTVVVPVQLSSKAGDALVLMSFPFLALAVMGYVSVWRSQSKTTKFLLIYPILLIASYAAYNFKLPFYSTVKGSFLVSLALPYAYFVVYALRKSSARQLTFFALYLLIYVVLLTKHFWILSWWYR